MYGIYIIKRGGWWVLVTLFCGLLVIAKAQASESRDIELAIERLQDKSLKACLVKLRRSNAWERLDQVRSIKCNSSKIRTIDGLEVFTHIESLSLYNNAITRFSCEYFPQLTSLNLAKNKINAFTCKNLKQLKALYLFANDMKALELESLNRLKIVKANNNIIDLFRYQNILSLEKLYLFNNKMEDVDIYHLPALKYMDVRENPMSDELYEEMDQLRGVTVLHDGNAEDWD